MTEDKACSAEEGFCSAREDETHCEHWWDGTRCCACGHDAVTTEDCDDD